MMRRVTGICLEWVLAATLVWGGTLARAAEGGAPGQEAGTLQDSQVSSGDVDMQTTLEEENITQEGVTNWTTPFSLGYYSILYGPSIGSPSSYQPKPNGVPNKDNPVNTRNFLTLGYALDQEVGLSATGYWHFQPVLDHSLTLKDPYARISHNNFMHLETLNWYADLRVHFPVTALSRDQDLLTGIQTYQTLSYIIPDTRFTLNLDGSARVNVYGNQGQGDDLELYIGPTVAYQLAPSISATLLYEMGASHQYGRPAFKFANDGTDLQPGVSWDITPNLNVNPYLTLYPGEISMASTSVGMTLSWILL